MKGEPFHEITCDYLDNLESPHATFIFKHCSKSESPEDLKLTVYTKLNYRGITEYASNIQKPVSFTFGGASSRRTKLGAIARDRKTATGIFRIPHQHL